MAAGPVVDQLASDYNGKPVVFLEYNYTQQVGDRSYYFWAAHNFGSAYYPMAIANSGHQVHDGPVDYYQVYKQMVDAELSRPPQAEVQAAVSRVGNHLHFQVSVKNLSGVTLSSDNIAKVHVIVYENTHVSLTNRYVRAEVDTLLTSPLANGATGVYELDTTDLTQVDWTKLHSIAVVDYLPENSTAFDMLQAAEAAAPSFSIQPPALTFLVDSKHPTNPARSIQTSGFSGITWTVTENISWLSVEAASGQAGTPIVVHVNAGGLVSGYQNGTIHVSANGSGLPFSQDIQVKAYLGPVFQLQLPIVKR